MRKGTVQNLLIILREILQNEEYIPNKNRIPDKLHFNLEATEYKPKEVIELKS